MRIRRCLAATLDRISWVSVLALAVALCPRAHALPPDVTQEDLFSSTTPVCGRDLDGNASVDLYELEWCHEETGLCPVDAAQCVPQSSDPECPSGSSYNMVTDRCEVSAPTPTCPQDYTYDPLLDRCRHDVVCLDGGVFNPDLDRCEKILPEQCPANYQVNATLSLCYLDVDCSGPFGTGIYDPGQDRCEMPFEWACPTGLNYDAETGLCLGTPYCPPPSVYNPADARDRCETEMLTDCPAGYTYDAGTDSCLASPSCPPPGVFSPGDGSCITSGVISCPPDSAWDPARGLCTADGTCPAGSYKQLSWDICYTNYLSLTCETYYSFNYSTKTCTRTPACGVATLDAVQDLCVVPYGAGETSCGANGFYTYYDLCYKPVSCPSPGYLQSSYDLCYYVPSCSSGYSFDTNNLYCSAYASCNNGGSTDLTLDECYTVVGRGCDDPYDYHVTYGCITNPTCESGIWSAVNRRCEQNATVECSSDGYSYNTTLRKCLRTPHCPDGPTYTASFNRELNQCEYRIAGACPTGYSNYADILCYASYLASPTELPYVNTTYGIYYNTASTSCTSQYNDGIHSYYYNATLAACTSSSVAFCPEYHSYNSVLDECYKNADYLCPSGFDAIAASSQCSRFPECNGNGQYNTTYDLCISDAYAIECADPDNYNYSVTLEACIANPSCPGGTRNGDVCEALPVNACPNPELGYTYAAEANRCETSPSCDLGGDYSSADDACILDPGAGACPPEFVEDPVSGMCVRDTGMCEGGVLDPFDDVCYQGALNPCPSGYVLNAYGTLCEMAPECPAPGAYDDINTHFCVSTADFICDEPGYSYNPAYGFCSETPDCLPGWLEPSTDICKSNRTYQCDAEYTLTGALCYQPVDCGADHYLDPALNVCVQTGDVCPAGSVLDQMFSRCEQAIDCPPGGTWSTTRRQCVAFLDPDCPVGMAPDFADPTLCVSIPDCGGIDGFTPYYDSLTHQCAHDAGWDCYGTYALDFSNFPTYYYPKCYGDGACPPPGGDYPTPEAATSYCTMAAAECPTGYVISPVDPGRCIATLECPSPGIFNPTYDRCDAGSPECADGYVWDVDARGCALEPECPSPSRFDTLHNRCEYLLDGQCEAPFAVSADGLSCEAPPECTGSGTFDGTLDLCSHEETVVCPTAPSGTYEWYQDHMKCGQEINCPDGLLWDPVENICFALPEVTCPDPYLANPETGDCRITPPECPDGGSYDFVTGTCDAGPVHSCGIVGFTPDPPHDVCFANADCSGGTLNPATDRCEDPPYIDCATWDWDPEDAICYQGPVCGLEGTFNPVESRCESAVDMGCPVGYVPDAELGQCVKQVACEEPAATFVQANDRCEMAAIEDCPIPYLVSSDGLRCETLPICSRGTFSPVYDKCVESWTPLCDVAWTYNDVEMVCENAPTCPQQTAYNPSTDRCEGDADSECPAGYTYDAVSDRCTYAYICPEGGVVNGDSAAERCEKSYIPTCDTAAGWAYDPVQHICHQGPVCAEPGALLNPATDRCELAPTPTCASPYVVDGTQCTASFLCPSEAEAYSPTLDKCVVEDTLACLADTYMENIGRGRCEDSDIACPSGLFDGGSNLCVGVALHNCPSGYGYNETLDKCTRDPTFDCPDAGVFNPADGHDQCEKAIAVSCTEADWIAAPEQDVCYQDIACAPGTLDAAEQRCEATAAYQCPAGFVPDPADNVCIAGNDCMDVYGAAYDAGVQKCYTTAAIDCGGDGYTYDAVTDQCELEPPCPGGYFAPSIQQCVQCPPGTTFNVFSELCETDTLACSDGWVWNGTQCEQSVVSPSVSLSISGTFQALERMERPGLVSYWEDFRATGAAIGVRNDHERMEWPFYVTGTTIYETGDGYSSICNKISDEHCFRVFAGSETEDAKICSYDDRCDTQRWCVHFVNAHFAGDGTYYWNAPGPLTSFAYTYQAFDGTYVPASLDVPAYYDTLTSIQGLGNELLLTYHRYPATGTTQHRICDPYDLLGPMSVSYYGIPTMSYTETIVLLPDQPCPNGGTQTSPTECTRVWYTSNICPAGTEPKPDGSECYALPVLTTPDCAGGAFDGEVCYREGLRICDTDNGWTFDSMFGYCTIAPPCSGAAWDTLDARCEAALVANCPTAWTYDLAATLCYRELDCSPGVFDATGDQRCEMSLAHDCGSYTEDTALNLCKAPVPCVAEDSWPALPPGYSIAMDVCMTDPVHACTDGLTYDPVEDRCEGTPGCASGGQLDPDHDVCYLDYDHLCATEAGWIYDAAAGLCVINPTCPDGGIPDFATLDKCVKTTTPDCGTYTLEGSICWGTADCGAAVYDDADDRCEQAIGQDCGSYTYDPVAALCFTSIDCPTDPAWVLSQGFWMDTVDLCGALPEKVCPAGVAATYDTDLDLCLGAAGCELPTDTLDFALDNCVRDIIHDCPEGMVYDEFSDSCTADLVCVAGGIYSVDRNQCELPVGSQCGSIYTYDPVLGVCFGDPVCGDGVYDPATGQCAAALLNTCEPNYVWDDPEQMCLASPHCPTDPATPLSATIEYSPVLKICSSDAGLECPPTMTWTGVPDLLCVASPTCPGEYLFNPAHDKCEGTSECPWGDEYVCLADPTDVGSDTNCVRGKYNALTEQCEGWAIAPVGSVFSAGLYDLRTDAAAQSLTTTYYTAPIGPDPLYGDGSNVVFSEFDGTITIVGHMWQAMRWDARVNLTHNGLDWYDISGPADPVLVGSTLFTFDPSTGAVGVGGSADIPGILHVRGRGELPVGGGKLEFYSDVVGGVYESANLVGTISFDATPFADDPVVYDRTYCSPNPCVNPQDTMLVEQIEADLRTLKNDGPINPAGCMGTIYIFNGEPKECLKPGWDTMWLNCCDSNTSAWAFGLLEEQCPPGSQDLVESRAMGRTHYVGTYCKRRIWGIGCVQYAEVDCSFTSKLARVVHEQGRPQLEFFAGTQTCSYTTAGLECDWGDAKKPLCLGFRPEHFGALDFGNMDLSEYLDDVVDQATAVDVGERLQNAFDTRMANP